jgi:hypothetical protein
MAQHVLSAPKIIVPLASIVEMVSVIARKLLVAVNRIVVFLL